MWIFDLFAELMSTQLRISRWRMTQGARTSREPPPDCDQWEVQRPAGLASPADASNAPDAHTSRQVTQASEHPASPLSQER